MIATVRDGDADFVARAAENGISAYVEGTAPQSVQGAIEIALRRYARPRSWPERSTSSKERSSAG